MSIVMTTLAALTLSVAPLGEEDTKPLPPLLCPLMGEPIDFTLAVETPQGPAFFCCAGCVKKYNKNPDKYAAKIEAQRIVLATLPKVQVLCPVSGNTTDPKVTIEHAGSQVSFCCGGCVDKFKAEPAKYAAKLANSYTYQTRCPVMGGEITPSSSMELPTGQTVYLCCDPCADKFKKDPAKYAAKLREQHIFVDVDKLKKMLGDS